MSAGAVIAAVIVSMILGWFWYSPALFGEHWMRHNKIKKGKGSMTPMWLMALFTLLTAVVFEILFDNFNIVGSAPGIVVAFWIWLGFVMTTQVSPVLFEEKPWQAFWINTSYSFLSLILMGAILGRW